ncbi:MAG: 3-isopropylmalate dehydratase large subunit [Myxococcales bacterium]|nr:3-isopropylmalate dehydratase large subunit [Myxococcales bacterium]MCB9519496.1 3-isopropylmalate dehydratase large subunit [Myxococcales bacterium]MCB9532096.1 3-isopropylmalate dehydratase large subunit [Myxococcales bacterium]MCB9533279.1 3-isopropylmalate dehydratase large subunit [Myxococcales bacterium]
MSGTLFEKVWALHRVGTLADGRDQLFVGLHLVHEVTSPQAFAALRERDIAVARPDRTFATVDHIVPTTDRHRPLRDDLAEEMLAALQANTAAAGIPLFDEQTHRQGIVHVIGPELGLTLPGMVICCGDSHTATHGAFGAIAFGIGTSQVRDVLATQTLAIEPLRVRRIWLEGELREGVFAKDVALHVIRTLGVHGGVGFAYEFAGPAVDAMDMEARMTLCNMSIEGGARVGYCNPDETTFAYLAGRPYAPSAGDWDAAVAWWRSVASDADATFDDEVRLDVSALAPVVTWGINPAQAVAVDESVPTKGTGAAIDEALAHMQLAGGAPILGTPVDVAFIGSCTNGRLSDLEAAAEVIRGRTVHPRVTAIVVPGSQQVDAAAREKGLDAVFRAAGFDWRLPGCSMCLGMNPDRLVGDQVCASSSNRNFKGRQGSPSGRTLLMSPAMVAAAAIAGAVVDVSATGGPT